jgi:hypothetical protein
MEGLTILIVEVLAVIRAFANETIGALEKSAGNNLGEEPFPRAGDEAARAAGGITDAEVGIAAQVRLHGLDERARRQVNA